MTSRRRTRTRTAIACVGAVALLLTPLPALARATPDLTGGAGTVPGATDPGGVRGQVDGARDINGELDGVPYEIRVPAEWNGTLLMYAHGYRDAADHPDEPDDRSVDAFFNDAVEDRLLDLGYALAGSAYAGNGWAVKEGVRDTKVLANHFTDVIGKPDTTLLAGFSMGSLVAYESIERYRNRYDGVLPGCSVGAGAPRTWDSTLALATAYDAVFGWPEEWGTPYDVRDDLDFDTEVLPVLQKQLSAPGGSAKLEFLRLVVGGTEGPEWPWAVAFFLTEARAELERRAGGPPTQNADHTYRLSAADRAHLAELGIGGEQIDGWLATMMANRVPAKPGPRRYLERYAAYTGKVTGPVLTLGTTTDALVVPAHISAYDATVADAGRTDMVSHAWTDGVGHCNFTLPQLVTSVQALETWVKTGERPTDFPAEDGFVDYTPPEWPQP